MSQYIVTRPARLDLKEINSYLTRLNKNAARNLRQRFKEQFKRLANFPNMGRNRDDLEPSMRSFTVEDYLIIYRAISGGVQILRVVSGYRDVEALFLSQDSDEEE